MKGFLTFGNVFDLHSLHTHSHGSLFSGVVIPSAWAEIGSNTLLNDTLVEWGIGAVEKQGGQDLKAEGFVRVCRYLVAKE